jgi:hypothetical protein
MMELAKGMTVDALAIIVSLIRCSRRRPLAVKATAMSSSAKLSVDPDSSP